MRCPYCGHAVTSVIDSRLSQESNTIRRRREKRQISYDDLEGTLNSIFNQCLSFSDKEIPSSEIGKIVMAELLKLDHVAYLRFASVYLNFDDMASFRDVIKVLEKDLSPEMKKKQINLLDDEDG